MSGSSKQNDLAKKYGVDQPVLKAYKPSLRERAQLAAEQAFTRAMGREPGYEARDKIEKLTGLLDFVPVVGDALGVDETKRALNSRRYVEAGLTGLGTALGVMPVVGDVAGKAVRGAAKPAEKAAAKLIEKYAAKAQDLKAKYGLPEFTTDLTPEQIEANRAAFLEGSAAPPVLYTGTSKDKDFNRFNVPRNGAWFTESPQSASAYALDNDSMALKTDNYRDFYNVNTASRVMPVHVSAKNPYVVDARAFNDQLQRLGGDNYKRAQSIMFDDLRAQGYDSVHLKSETPGEDVWVALGKPTQIKSKLNRGTFDPSDPHLNKARGGLAKKYGVRPS